MCFLFSFWMVDVHFPCIDQEGDEAEAVIKQMLQGVVLVVGAWAGEIIRKVQSIPD